MRKLLLSLMILALSSVTFADTVDAESLKVKMYKFYVSLNADCSNPVLVYSNDDPSYANMSGEAELFSEELADGTYNCVIIEMSDMIKFTPADDIVINSETVCDASVEYTRDVCRAHGDDESDLWNTVSRVGSTDLICAEGQSEERVFLYLTTAITEEDDENNLIFISPADTAITIPTGKNKGDRLASALTKSGSLSGVFYVDVSNKIEGRNFGEGDTECDMQKPVFGFRTIQI